MVAAQIVDALLGLIVKLTSVCFTVVAYEGFETVGTVVVDDFVGDDEGQLGLVLELGHETYVYKYHALRRGEGIDPWGGDGVEAELGAKGGIVFEEGVGYAGGEQADGVAINDVASGHELIDKVGRLENLPFVAHPSARILLGPLHVGCEELLNIHTEIGGNRALAAEGLCIERGSRKEERKGKE